MSDDEVRNYGNVPTESPPLSPIKETKTLIGTQKVSSSFLTDHEQWKKVKETNNDIQDVIADLDTRLNRVLAKQEYEYLKGYNIYVKKKEKELRQLIDKLNQKNSTSNTKDKKINDLNTTIQRIREDQINLEKMKEKQRKETLKWRSKAENLDEDCKFLQKQVKETKKQNHLLKLAITRLQYELENRNEKDGNTFLTEAVDDNTQMKPEEILEILKSDYIDSNQLSILEKSNLFDTSALNTSINEISKTKPSLDRSTLTSVRNRSSQRNARSPSSNYQNVPTQNIKYEAFLDMLFSSNYDEERKKSELKLYMQAVETRFNNNLKELRNKVEKERKKRIKIESFKVNDATNKNELETIFVDCIEEVRKDIMKRRLKNEIQNKKRFKPIDKDSEEAKEFEESLLKLAQLAKNKIKISEFTPIDRWNLLDLFVNNEKTLLKIYEAWFPHRTNNFADPNQNMSGSTGMNSSRPNHQKNFSMDNFSRTDFNDNLRGGLAITNIDKTGENSFYGNQIEPLSGFENNQDINENVKINDNNENQSILPTINQNRNIEVLPKLGKGFTKPSSLGNVSGFGKLKK